MFEGIIFLFQTLKVEDRFHPFQLYVRQFLSDDNKNPTNLHNSTYSGKRVLPTEELDRCKDVVVCVFRHRQIEGRQTSNMIDSMA